MSTSFFPRTIDLLRKIKFISCIPLYHLCKLLPLQNKVVATTFRGRKYGDNSQFIIEELHRQNPTLDLVWLKNPNNYNYLLPSYIRAVSFFDQWRKTYEYATAKVWINTHRMEYNVRKRRGQLFIDTWHGGLGIKKIEGDIPQVLEVPRNRKEIENTAKLADLFISNSNHLTKIYRSAFNYKGKIWKCGYPKNDILLKENPCIFAKVKDFFKLSPDSKILLYAPTFRDELEKKNIFDFKPYDINFSSLKEELQNSWGGKWSILIRWHPIMLKRINSVNAIYGDSVIDASYYPDMQELIMSSDIMLSDYSSCLFDAALIGKPCFMYATDFDEYQKGRGVYYNLNEMPFPYGRNNQDLLAKIRHFSKNDYQKNWEIFVQKTGLTETGHAAHDIAYVINEFIKGNKKPLKEIKSEP